jgi:hypothetical protein
MSQSLNILILALSSPTRCPACAFPSASLAKELQRWPIHSSCFCRQKWEQLYHLEYGCHLGRRFMVPRQPTHIGHHNWGAILFFKSYKAFSHFSYSNNFMLISTLLSSQSQQVMSNPLGVLLANLISPLIVGNCEQVYKAGSPSIS